MPNPEKKIQILPKTLWPIDASHIKEFSEAFAIPEAELTSIEYPWDVLVLLQRKLKEVITESRIDLGVEVSKHAYIEGPVWIEEGAKVLPFSIVIGPAYIGKNTLVGNHTQIRGAFVGSNSLVGAGTEVVRSVCGKGCTFHRNYVGDSLLGENVQVGGDSGFANMRLDQQNVFSSIDGRSIDTDLSKLGAIIGSNTIVAGASAATMPGIKVGQNCLIGPGVLVFKDLPNNSKIRVIQGQEITKIE